MNKKLNKIIVILVIIAISVTLYFIALVNHPQLDNPLRNYEYGNYSIYNVEFKDRVDATQEIFVSIKMINNGKYEFKNSYLDWSMPQAIGRGTLAYKVTIQPGDTSIMTTSWIIPDGLTDFTIELKPVFTDDKPFKILSFSW